MKFHFICLKLQTKSGLILFFALLLCCFWAIWTSFHLLVVLKSAQKHHTRDKTTEGISLKKEHFEPNLIITRLVCVWYEYGQCKWTNLLRHQAPEVTRCPVRKSAGESIRFHGNYLIPAATENEIRVLPWCFLRCFTGKQQKLPGVPPVNLRGKVFLSRFVISAIWQITWSRLLSRNGIQVLPWCFLRCFARKQQKLPGVPPEICRERYLSLAKLRSKS